MIDAQRMVAAALLAALALGAPTGVLADAETAMRTEDVVRMLVAGADASTIIKEIRARPVDFDLSEEIVAELRIAGVPDEVIQAMRERQAELHPVAPPAGNEVPAAEAEDGASRLVIAIEGAPLDGDEAGEPEALYFPALLPAPVAQALEIGDGSKPLPIQALAIFLACRTAVHVPDHWRSASPLGRDFVSMPRHGMIAFLSGGDRVSAADLPDGVAKRLRRAPGDAGYLRLTLPAELEAELDPSEVHDLSFGVAIEVEGRFLRVTSDDRDALAIGDDRVLRVRVVNDSSDKDFGITATIVDR